MNGSESLEDALEDIESDYEFEQEVAGLLEDSGEARRRPVRTARGAGYYRPRTQNRYVTEAQLRTALAKVSRDVKTNAVAITAVGKRVDTVLAEQRKQTDLLRKEIKDRKTEEAKMKSNLQLTSLLPLLTSKSITTVAADTIGGAPVAPGTKLAVSPDSLGLLLPMLLLGDGLGGGGSGGDGSNMLFLALALSGSL